MKKTIKTTLDGVPVEFELIKVGPSSKLMIDNMKTNLAREIVLDNSQVAINQPVEQNKKEIKVMNQDKQVVQDGEGQESKLVEQIEQIGQEIQNATPEKPWWTSRIIIANLAFIISALAAVFGFNIQISEEWITAIGALMGVYNIYLRKKTSQAISKQLLPDMQILHFK